MKPYLFWLLAFLQTTVLAAQGRYTIIINEIMADPTPAAGLPDHEWIELKNRSTSPINLQNWRIVDAGNQSSVMPSFVLQPDSLLIICTAGAAPALSAYGAVLAVSNFPSLDNEGDLVALKSPAGTIIHAVRYSTTWYSNELKKNGGWSLEMIDPSSPCSINNNWIASNHSIGGTPGTVNSVNTINNDLAAPELKRSYTTDSLTMILAFNEPVDSTASSRISNYTIEGGITITNAMALPPLFNEVQLRLHSPLQHTTIYTVTANGIGNCKGNTISGSRTVKSGLASAIAETDVVINEILFDPPPDGLDYVELYNRSNKIIDASKLYLANRNSTGVIASITQLIKTAFFVFPGDYLLITEDADNLARHYFVKQPDAIQVISDLPSYPDDKGSVILLNSQGTIIDEVNYNENWHFELLNNTESVSLERIDAGNSSNKPDNWHSASSTSGYGTPGYKNSQHRDQQALIAAITISPGVFSPDNDGRDDVLNIQYKVAQPGYVANIVIFDAAGRRIRNLVRNDVLGNAGGWNWDGLDDKKQALPIGTYVVYTEMFNLQGKKEYFKNVVVLGRKLN
jgi:hypothetical protein